MNPAACGRVGPGGGATLCTPTPWLPGCHPTPALTSAQAAVRRTLPPTAQPPPLPQAPAKVGQGRASLEGTRGALAFMGPADPGATPGKAPHGVGVA